MWTIFDGVILGSNANIIGQYWEGLNSALKQRLLLDLK